MLPNERQLITDLFDRLRGFGAPQKDQEAEQLIIQLARQNPDAGYMLVQSVLVQEQALQQMTERVQDLEQQVRELEQSNRAPAQASGGSFLGGLFGGGSKPQPSVPTSRSSSMGGQPAASPGGPWGRGASSGGYQQPMQQQPMQQPAGGGFMKGAMATAAGVAGGMLAANAISNMMHGGNAAHAATPGNSGFDQAAANRAQDEAQDNEPQYQDDGDNDPGNTDVADTSWDGGGDVEL